MNATDEQSNVIRTTRESRSKENQHRKPQTCNKRPK